MTTTTAPTIQQGLIIETKFLGPTDHRGSRVVAVCKRASDQTYRKTIDWRHAFSSDQNHESCCRQLMALIEEDLQFSDSEPFQIVGRGYGGSNDACWYWLINRGGC